VTEILASEFNQGYMGSYGIVGLGPNSPLITTFIDYSSSQLKYSVAAQDTQSQVQGIRTATTTSDVGVVFGIDELPSEYSD